MMDISMDSLREFLNRGVKNSGYMMRKQSTITFYLVIFFLLYFIVDSFIRLREPFELIPMLRNIVIMSFLSVSLFLSIKRPDTYSAPLITLLGFTLMFPLSCYLYENTLLAKICMVIVPIIAAMMQVRYKWKLVLFFLSIISFFIANLAVGQPFYQDNLLVTCTVPIFFTTFYFYENLKENSDARVNLIEELENKVLELEEKNKELHQKNKELEQFNYITSHDLQEPLLTITGFSQLLNKKYHDVLDEQGKKSLTHINESTTRMSELIKALLDYSRIGNSMVVEEVNLNELIKDVVKDLELQIEEAQAHLEIMDLPTIRGLRNELGLLFQNLISNAIKFRKKGVPPYIQISVEDTSEKWHFSVSDNGIGISEEHHSKIFDMFQRVYTRDKYVGSGIGLAHCKKIANLHKGEIALDSEEGKGSTFSFTISKEPKNE